MSFTIKYKPLFKVNLFHLFFLNKGTEDFISMSDADKNNQLATYSVSNFFTIRPARSTNQKLHGSRLVFKTTNTGFSVWTKVTEADEKEPFIELHDDFSLSFLIQVKDLYYLNYTGLQLENAGKTYFFSNRRPSTEPIAFPFIRLTGTNTEIDDTFILSEDGTTEQLADLGTDEKNNLFGIVKLWIKGENSAMDITDVTGKIPEPETQFELFLGNRKTYWRYLFNNDQTVVPGDDVEIENGNAKILVTKNEQPLTQNGFVSIELGGVELPNPDAKLIKPNSTNNKIYSEIYM